MRTTPTVLFALILAPFLSAPAQVLAQPDGAGGDRSSDLGHRAEPADLSEFAETLRERMGVPGLSIAAVNAEGPLAWGVAGVRSARGEDPVQRADRFHIGSLTKSMTATLVARFVEDGRLAWESTIEELAPELAAQIPERARAITVRQLLSHRAGLPDDRAGGAMLVSMWSLKGDMIEQREAVAVGYLNEPNNTEPGTAFVYSNAGYIIAGHLLEVITGEPWEALIEREVFEPLAMTTAGQGPPGMDPEQGDQPFGHGRGNEIYNPIPQRLGADNPPPLGPAGRAHMSSEDLAAFARAHLRGQQGLDGFLDAATIQVLHSDPESDGYALGWGVAGDGITRRSVHAGSNNRWLAFIIVWPGRNVAAVACMNGVPPEGRTGDPLGAIVNELERRGMIAPLPKTSAEP